MPTILGIDLSISNTGLCIIDDSKTVIELNTTNPVKGKGRDERITFSRIESQLDFILSKVKEHPIDWIISEGMSMAQYSQSREVLAYLHGIVKRALYKLGYIIEIVPPPTLKKYVTGKGNAEKTDMIKIAINEWGLDLDSYKKKDDLVDAYALARMGWDSCVYLAGHDIKPERLAILKSRLMVNTAGEIMINKGLDLSRTDKE